MPNTKSAKKALRSSAKKREYNIVTKFKIKNALKTLRKGLKTEPTDFQDNLSKTFSAIDKAVKTNLLHRNTAARKKSRLVAMIRRTISGTEVK
jgi:small subunit ribosomal protein S20